MVALAAGKEAFSDYSHVYSPKKFTQPQLFACLVLKEFENKDYRGIQQFLLDCSDLRDAIGLKLVPHWTTLQKASKRLLALPKVRELLPKDKYRRLMKTHFNRKAYRRRPQVETVYSMLKRNVGDALRGRSAG